MSKETRPSLLAKMLMGMIVWYQKHLSPDHSPRKANHPYGYCRFTPTCSQYGYGVIEKYGALRGSLMALWRVIRCNPWNKGGHDPVP